MRIPTRLQRSYINRILLILGVLTTAIPAWAATGARIFTTVPDFSTCENSMQPAMVNTALSAEVNGEIGLLPQLSDDFSGSLIDPALWTSGIYTSTLNPGGRPPDVAVGNNLVMVSSSNQSPLDGSYLRASQIQQYGTIEGEVLFSKGWYQHFGLATTGFKDDFRFALFSTGEDKPGIYAPNTLYARVNNNDIERMIVLGPIPTSPVRLRLEWTNAGGADILHFYSGFNGATYTRMDEISLASYADPNKTFPQPLYIHLSNKSTNIINHNSDPGPAWALSANWIRSLPYNTASGSYTSCPIYVDLSQHQTWGPVSFTTNIPPSGGGASVEVRTSDDAVHWSAFTAVASGATPSIPPGIYVQYRVTLTRGANPNDSPRLTSISLGYTNQSTLQPYVAPSSGPMGTHFLFVGTGFSPNNILTITLDNRIIGTQPSNASGGVAFYVNSSNFSQGAHTIKISGTGRSTLSLIFTVTTGVAGPPAPGGTYTFQPIVRVALPVMWR